MKIDRHNYEEFFLLYVDNELTAEERKSVEQFVHDNPDLAGELALFSQASLASDDTIVFEGKEMLMKKESGSLISLNNYEEFLVAYLDNELTTTERKEFEKFAAIHPGILEELAVFQQTKLQPDPEIVFADKEILYRKEEKVRVISMQWWKVAVAAVVVLTLGITAIRVLIRNTIVAPVVAKTNNEKTEQPANTGTDTGKAVQNIPALPEYKEGVASVKTTDVKEITAPIQKVNVGKTRNKAIASPAALNNNDKDAIALTRVPAKNPDAVNGSTIVESKTIDNTLPDKKETAVINNTIAANNAPAIKNINSNAVTNNSDKPYNTVETVPVKEKDIEPVFVSNHESNNKKTRGFFRKATRIFERRTNISSADNDEDKVLIGVLAVKLK